MTAHDSLFRRCTCNPILSAPDWPHTVNAVLNPGAVRLPDGTTFLLCRVEDRRGISSLWAARSGDGATGWRIDDKPWLPPDLANHPEETWGVEDPRITWLDEIQKYAVTYTAYSPAGPAVALALTPDFEKFERVGMVMLPDNKDAALLPRRINGRWQMLHRPHAGVSTDIWLAESPDLKHWGGYRRVLAARHGAWWDACRIGLGPPLIETERGWLMIYHGVRQTAAGGLYRVGVALLDATDPCRVLRRGDEWVFGPNEDYERQGDVGDVVFPCGTTTGPDLDTLNIYYGAADTCIGLATASISELLSWLDRHS
ncbi:glycosidase [candidate division WOR-3 bacterium]|uniref:Glycosidase n=1 Tax=candidate division WOR-3 bacterium TaxID=2052148 RepID=A0A937XBD3_UNCW3|nr:glycosidase [candidate division WOR-3 bacterium]